VSAPPTLPGRELHADQVASFLSTMGFQYRIDDDTAWGTVVVDEYLRSAPHWPSPSALLTFADVLIGVLASRETAPRVSITIDLSVHIVGSMPHGGELELSGRMVKVGRTVSIGSTDIRARDSGALVARAVGTFAASPRPQDVADSFPRQASAGSTGRLGATLAEHVGIEIVSPGVAEISLGPDRLNGTESLQGGLVALLAETAAQRVATATLGAPAVLDALEVHYVAAARVGPFRTRTRVLGPDALEVEVRDPGRDDRIVAVAVARTRPAPTRSDMVSP